MPRGFLVLCVLRRDVLYSDYAFFPFTAMATMELASKRKG